MNTDAVEQVIARDAIREALYRYCRGVDRKCRAELELAFWPDGTDDHGFAFEALPEHAVPAAVFIDRLLEALANLRSAHHLTNILIEFEGDGTARVESYFIAWQELPNGAGGEDFIALSGRYLDRFACRDGAWRIARRLVVYDFEQTHAAGTWARAFLPSLLRRGRPFPEDALYRLA